MGAYNEVRARLVCPSCKMDVEATVQFKYGSVVHHKYSIGDKIVWGANDVGRPGRQLVVVEGEAMGCPNCGYDADWPAYIVVENDIIRSVTNATGAYDFASTAESYIVLRE
jgi:hypothetical protein